MTGIRIIIDNNENEWTFVGIADSVGLPMSIGKWVDRGDGFHELHITSQEVSAKIRKRDILQNTIGFIGLIVAAFFFGVAWASTIQT